MVAPRQTDDRRLLAKSGKIVLSCLPGLEGWPLGCLPMKTLKRFLLDQSAATSIEYALIAAGIAMVIIVAVNNAGTALNGKYEMIRSKVQ
jgi:pilus assembly protein Flp/PilA